eukprot:COSAG05_NODE_192_length_14608_cov_6.266386_13_plen_231_part_00
MRHATCSGANLAARAARAGSRGPASQPASHWPHWHPLGRQMGESKLAGLQILEIHQRCTVQARDAILQRQFKGTTLLGCCGSAPAPSERWKATHWKVNKEQHAGTLERMKNGYLSKYAQELSHLRQQAIQEAQQVQGGTVTSVMAGEPQLAAMAQQAVSLDQQGRCMEAAEQYTQAANGMLALAAAGGWAGAASNKHEARASEYIARAQELELQENLSGGALATGARGSV